MEDNITDQFYSKEKAIDHALWLNFKYRIAKIQFGVINEPIGSNNWVVCEEATAEDLGISFLDILPKDYSKMTFRHIQHIKMDRDPFPHWETIKGMVSIMDGEILRFILEKNIPLEKWIRSELAARGFDKNHRWCGFEQAEKIWIGDKE